MKYLDRKYLTYLAGGAKGVATHLRLSRPKKVKNLKQGAALGALHNLISAFTQTKIEKRTYNLNIALSEYVHAIDRAIDSADYLPRKTAEFKMRDLKQIKTANLELTLLVRELKKAKLTKEQQRAIVKTVANFRRSAVQEVERTMKSPFASKEETLRGTEQTSGEFIGTLAEIHSILAGLSAEKVAKTKHTFKLVGSALQLRDDFRDCTLDFGIVQNSTISIAQKYPEEFEKIRQQKGKGTARGWAKANLPKTMADINQVFENYISAIQNTPQGNQLAQTCRSLFYMK